MNGPPSPPARPARDSSATGEFVPLRVATTTVGPQGVTDRAGLDPDQVVLTGPGSVMQVAFGTATHRGRVRTLNEDAYGIAPPYFVVTDGMGGHAAGDVAAAIVVEQFTHVANGASIGDLDAVTAAIDDAELRIRAGSGGGATVVGITACLHQGQAAWLAFNVGDSRLYRCQDGILSQVSVDHSLVQELVDAGRIDAGERRSHPKRNVITRAVGVPGDAGADTWVLPAVEGDRLLMCTDGVTGELTDETIQAVLTTHLNPQHAADVLVATAVRAGGRDNATAVVVDVLAIASSPSAPTVRFTSEDLQDTARRLPESDHELTRPRPLGDSA